MNKTAATMGVLLGLLLVGTVKLSWSYQGGQIQHMDCNNCRSEVSTIPSQHTGFPPHSDWEVKSSTQFDHAAISGVSLERSYSTKIGADETRFSRFQVVSRLALPLASARYKIISPEGSVAFEAPLKIDHNGSKELILKLRDEKSRVNAMKYVKQNSIIVVTIVCQSGTAIREENVRVLAGDAKAKFPEYPAEFRTSRDF